MTSIPTARRKLATTAIHVGVLTFALLLGSPAAALAASPSPNPSSSAGEGKGVTPPTGSPKAVYGIGPSSANAVDGRPRFKWSAGPGGTLQDHVAVVNSGATPLTLDLYARDAVNQPDGSLGLQTKAAKPVDAGLWITLEIPHGASSIAVPGRSTVIVPVSLAVPSNASPGDHTGGIIVSLTAQSTSTGAQTLTPNLEQRVAVPVAIRIAGPLRPSLSVQSLSASYGQTLNPVGSGHATVTYKVVNTGNVNLGGHEAVSISGLFGSTVHAKAPDVPVLLPGSSIIESIPVHGVLPEFRMSARATITPLAASGDVDPGLIATSGSKHFWAVPWLLLGIIALLLLGWRQRRRRKRPSTTGRHGTKSGGGTRRRGSAPPQTARRPAEVAPDGVTVTSSFVRVVRRVAVTIAAAALAFAIPAGTAWAASLPYTDAAAQGALGLCDKNGNNITHGSVYDKPFVWRAVGATPAPASVRGSGRNATLYAYQPRKGIDPHEWSGEQLTANAAYSDPNIPIAQATDRDIALSDYLNDYPPQWDRLIELRIFYGATSGDLTGSYPAANIRVTGTKWTLVTGAKVNCKAGSAVSMEDALQSSNPAGRGPAQPLTELAAKAVGAPMPKSSAGPLTGTASDVKTQANASSSGSRSGAGGVLSVVGVVVVLGLGGGLYRLKRSRST